MVHGFWGQIQPTHSIGVTKVLVFHVWGSCLGSICGPSRFCKGQKITNRIRLCGGVRLRICDVRGTIPGNLQARIPSVILCDDLLLRLSDFVTIVS